MNVGVKKDKKCWRKKGIKKHERMKERYKIKEWIKWKKKK